MTYLLEARKTGGEKAPAFPSEVSKLVAEVNPLQQELMQEKNLTLGDTKTRGKLSHAKWSQHYLLTLTLLTGKERQKSRKMKDSQKYCNFQSLLKTFYDNL